MKDTTFQDAQLGPRLLLGDVDAAPRSIAELEAKYAQLPFQVKARDLDEVFDKMQAEDWSPEWQANASSLIRKGGVSHSSMCVGDIIQEGASFYLVAMEGFTELKLD